MTLALDRGLALLERLSGQPEGMPLTALADELDIPRSACHRLLAELQRRGYVRQPRSQGDYVLTAKLASLGLGFLSSSGIVDIAEPLLERLAKESGELVRLAIVDGDRLTWVAKAQGTRKGLRYDPDMGMDARLSCTASGHAWLLTLSDERALELVSRQGFGQPKDYGPQGADHGEGAARRAACGAHARLRDDRRDVRTGHDGHGRAGAARPRGGGCDQHRRAAPAADAGAHAAARAGPARGHGGTRPDQPRVHAVRAAAARQVLIANAARSARSSR